MVLGVSAAWLIKLPLGLLLATSAGLGAAGAWLGVTAEVVVLSVAVVWRLRSGAWLPATAGDRPPLAIAAK